MRMNFVLLKGRLIDMSEFIGSACALSCYIEEYVSSRTGGLAARLRDKATNRRVVIDATGVMSPEQSTLHLLRFLSQARLQHRIMPTIFDRDGRDIVRVTGLLQEETDEEIVVSIACEGGGYAFA